jgi:hypothetical protein
MHSSTVSGTVLHHPGVYWFNNGLFGVCQLEAATL